MDELKRQLEFAIEKRADWVRAAQNYVPGSNDWRLCIGGVREWEKQIDYLNAKIAELEAQQTDAAQRRAHIAPVSPPGME